MEKTYNLKSILFYAFIISIPFFGYSFYDIRIGEANDGGVGLGRPDWVLGGLLILASLLSRSRRIGHEPSSTEVRKIKFLVLLFNYAISLSIVNLFDANRAQLVDFFSIALQFIFVSMVFFAISNLLLSDDQLLKAFKLWIAVAFVIALYGIYQAFARNMNLPFAYLPISNPSVAHGGMIGRVVGGYTSVSSVFREPSWLGSYLIAPIILVGGTILFRLHDGFFGKRAAWLILIALFTSLLLSLSLAGFVTLFVVGFLVAMGAGVRRSKIFLLVIIVVLLIWGLNFLLSRSLNINFIEVLSSRIETENLSSPVEGTSYRNRIKGLIGGLKAWLYHPILGVGLGQLKYYPELAQSLYHRERGWTNNAWVQVLVETGIIGFSALVALIFTVLGLVKQGYNQATNPKYRFLLWACYYILLADIINSIFTHTWHHPQRWFTLSIAALLLGHGRVYGEK